MYISQGDLKVNNYSSSSPSIAAINFLTESELYDPTITCNTTHKDYGHPSIIFVECHRDWELLGAPLISPVGLLNFEETKKLADTKPGNTTLSSPIDTAVYNAATGLDGRARPNDFNTITIGFFPDGRIHSVNSTMRLLSKIDKNQLETILTPTEALQEIVDNKATLSISLPLGSGLTDWNKIYPTEYAVAQDAQIDELNAVYLEKPMSQGQKSYVPAYLARGTAQLSTGYKVKFVLAIPAIKGASRVLAATTGTPINIGTFNFSSPTPSPAITPTVTPQDTDTVPTPTVTVNSGPNTNTRCYAASQDSLNIVELNIEGYGKLTVSMNWNNDNTYRTYHFVSDSLIKPSAEFNLIRDKFFKAVEQQYVITGAKILSKALTPPTTARERLTFRNSTSAEALERATKGPTSRGDLPQSVPNCTPQLQSNGGDLCFDMAKAQEISNAIKNQLEPIQNDLTKINEIASKPNLFPDKTLSSLSWLFHFYVAGKSNAMSLATSPQDSIKYACYISGESPRIFFYGTIGNITIHPSKKITYSEVGVVNNGWNGTIIDGIFTDQFGKQHSSLYYEYDASTITIPTSTTGYVTSKDSVGTIIHTLSAKLGLTFAEEKALLLDAQNALYQHAPNQKILISLMSAPDQIKHIPLTIHPATPIQRVHLLITPINKSIDIKPPTISKIHREMPMILEVGAMLKNSY